MKTPRFSGPFKWSAVRQQLLSLREDIQSIQKVAGRNVTIDEHRGKGTVINAIRQSVVQPVPPDECTLPVGDCPHAVCFELFLDDTDASNQDFFDMYFVGAYFDGTDWQVYGDTSASLTAVSAFNTWHKFIFQFTKQGDGSVLGEWSVDGVAGPSFNALPAGAIAGSITSIQFGAQGGAGPKHRSIRNITILGFAISFDFPPDSFSFLVGTGISESGGVLRIDNDSDDDAYGNKTTYADLICCTCPDSPAWRDCVEISTVDISYDFTVTSTVTDCAFTKSNSWNFHWDRIDRTVSFDPGAFQFHAYQQRSDAWGGGCLLIMEANDSRWGGVGIRHDFDIDNSICMSIQDTIGANSIAGDGCDPGTFSFAGNESSVFVSKCRCEDESHNFSDCDQCNNPECGEGLVRNDCGSIFCGPGTPGNLTPDLSYLPGDISAIKGTYVTENTCLDSDRTMTVTITVTIA